MVDPQIVHLFDFRASVDGAFQQLSDCLAHRARDLHEGPIWGQERDRNLDSIRDIARQLDYWASAAQSVSELKLAEEDDLEKAPTDDPDLLRMAPNRLEAVKNLEELVGFSHKVLEELKTIRDTPGRLIDLYSSGKLEYFGPDNEGAPDLRWIVDYDLVSLESEVAGWEFVDAQCASLAEQKRAIWAQYRKIRDEEVLPRHRAEMEKLRSLN